MKETLKDLFGFMYSLSMGDYFFFIGTFLLIVLFIYIIYLLKSEPDELPKKKEDKFDISKVTKNLEENYKPATPNIKLTSCEEEQENNAIISYDELVKTREMNVVTYDDNFSNTEPDLDIKKIDLEGTGKIKIIDPKIEVKLIEYEKEEEFLRVLKDLQSKLS